MSFNNPTSKFTDLYCKIIKNNRTFIISSSPTDNNINNYIELLKKDNIDLLIKATPAELYDTNIYKLNDIDYLNLSFTDGMMPNDNIINDIIEIGKKYNSICVHCKAGLGRAPLLVALIFIFEFNMNPLDSIIEIKNISPKAFNTNQANFLFNFKKSKYNNKNNKCIIL